MENVFTSSKPFLTVAKVLGFFPMTVTQNSMKVKWFGVFMTCCLSTALIAMNFVIFLNHNNLTPDKNNFLVNAWDLVRKAEWLSYIVLVSYQFHARKKIFSFLKCMHSFDEKVRKVLKVSK